jgi:hypothetical protein
MLPGAAQKGVDDGVERNPRAGNPVAVVAPFKYFLAIKETPTIFWPI